MEGTVRMATEEREWTDITIDLLPDEFRLLLCKARCLQLV